MFSQACVKTAVHGAGVSASGSGSACVDTPGQVPPPLGRHPSGQTLPPPPIITEVGGTHPTGMHYFFLYK